MPLRDAAHAESELERIRIELAILRAVKVRDDLTKLVSHNPLNSFSLNEIGQIDSRLHDLEIDARDLVHTLPPKSPAARGDDRPDAPFVLRDPLPAQTPYRIEQVAAKFASRNPDLTVKD